MSGRGVTDAEFARALAQGQLEAESEIRARAVRYVAERDAIEIVTTRGAGFVIPRAWIGALQGLPVESLSRLEVWPGGSAIAIEDQDVHISVEGLIAAVLPAMLPQRVVTK